MWSIRHLALALLALAPLSGVAAPALKVTRSVIVHAAPMVVWATVGHFGNQHRWHPGVASDEIVSGSANQPGAVCVLTLRAGGSVRERLLSFDSKHRRYSYAIIDGALPVSGYAATISVKGAGPNRSKVTWSSTFEPRNRGSQRGGNDDQLVATRATDDFYRTGLDNLKTLIETRKH